MLFFNLLTHDRCDWMYHIPEFVYVLARKWSGRLYQISTQRKSINLCPLWLVICRLLTPIVPLYVFSFPTCASISYCLLADSQIFAPICYIIDINFPSFYPSWIPTYICLLWICIKKLWSYSRRCEFYDVRPHWCVYHKSNASFGILLFPITKYWWVFISQISFPVYVVSCIAVFKLYFCSLVMFISDPAWF